MGIDHSGAERITNAQDVRDRRKHGRFYFDFLPTGKIDNRPAIAPRHKQRRPKVFSHVRMIARPERDH
jgi:hypothetical protein